MGTRAGTCALTHTAITEGERVLLVHLRAHPVSGNYAPMLARPYQMLVELAQQEGGELHGRVTDTLAELRATRPELAAQLEALLPAPGLPYVAVVGEYDGGGWITRGGSPYVSGEPTARALRSAGMDPFQDPRLPPETSFLVKASVVSAQFLDGQPLTDDNAPRVLEPLATLAHAARVPLFGGSEPTLGGQWVDEDELRAQRAVHALALAELDRQAARLQ